MNQSWMKNADLWGGACVCVQGKGHYHHMKKWSHSLKLSDQKQSESRLRSHCLAQMCGIGYISHWPRKNIGFCLFATVDQTEVKSFPQYFLKSPRAVLYLRVTLGRKTEEF